MSGGFLLTCHEELMPSCLAEELVTPWTGPVHHRTTERQTISCSLSYSFSQTALVLLSFSQQHIQPHVFQVSKNIEHLMCRKPYLHSTSQASTALVWSGPNTINVFSLSRKPIRSGEELYDLLTDNRLDITVLCVQSRTHRWLVSSNSTEWYWSGISCQPQTVHSLTRCHLGDLG